jgi:hypothetical protein
MDPDPFAVDPVDIRRRAYEIYLSRGARPGTALEDWLQAERELTQARLHSMDEPRASLSLPDDWQLARAAGTNLLVVGPDEQTRALVDALRPQLREPVIVVRPGEPLALAPPGEVGTLILFDVSKLGLPEQRRLLEWQERAEVRTQVVSTTSVPLLPLVAAGACLAELYYRLNIVCLELVRHRSVRRQEFGKPIDPTPESPASGATAATYAT